MDENVPVNHRWAARFSVIVGLAGLVSGCMAPAPTGGSVVATPGSASAQASVEASLLGASSVPEQAPGGLIAVQEYKAGDARVLTNSVFNNPLIAGVAPRINWTDLEPGAGEFNWQIVDQVFSEAAASHKFVVLTIVPGFGTPTWALQGVASATFARQYGPEAGQPGVLPMPWDQTYLSRWFAFLHAVAARYGANPAFRMISAAGPTSVSEEMSLPDVGSDVSSWIGLGYTPTKYAAAWASVFREYLQAFPGQYISLALYPGLAIDDNGQRDAAQRGATTSSVVAEGLKALPRFVLQGNGLVASSNGDNVYNVVQAEAGAAVTGFELTTAATINPAREGDAANPVHALTLALTRGIAAHVDFLEVYEADVVNPLMQPELEQAISLLAH